MSSIGKGRAAAAIVFLASLLVVAGCGSSSPAGTTAAATTSAGTTNADASPGFAPAAVEKMIRRSIRPSLAANLGEGATMKVHCRATGGATLSCVTTLVPADAGLDPIRVVYGVTCDARTCRWQPTG